jgi:hypothetical protein
VSRRFLSLIKRRTSVRGSASAIAEAGIVGLGFRGSRTPAVGGSDGRLPRSRSRIQRSATASEVPMRSIVCPALAAGTAPGRSFSLSGHAVSVACVHGLVAGQSSSGRDAGLSCSPSSVRAGEIGMPVLGERFEGALAEFGRRCERWLRVAHATGAADVVAACRRVWQPTPPRCPGSSAACNGEHDDCQCWSLRSVQA